MPASLLSSILATEGKSRLIRPCLTELQSLPIHELIVIKVPLQRPVLLQVKTNGQPGQQNLPLQVKITNTIS